jgi:hypothetical protein
MCSPGTPPPDVNVNEAKDYYGWLTVDGYWTTTGGEWEQGCSVLGDAPPGRERPGYETAPGEPGF